MISKLEQFKALLNSEEFETKFKKSCNWESSRGNNICKLELVKNHLVYSNTENLTISLFNEYLMENHGIIYLWAKSDDEIGSILNYVELVKNKLDELRFIYSEDNIIASIGNESYEKYIFYIKLNLY